MSEPGGNVLQAALDQTIAGANVLETHSEFLQMLGGRVRAHRDSASMSRKVLAQRSNVSERYLAQLESGKGNISIKLLRNVSNALDIPLDQLVASEIRSSL